MKTIEQLQDEVAMLSELVKESTYQEIRHALRSDWVSLTHAEIDDIMVATSGNSFKYARAIEAKLKEKNCG